MTDHEQYAHLYEDFLAYLDGEQDEPDLSDVPMPVREQLISAFETMRNDYGVLAGLPDLADDPVFAALGFDRVGSDVEIDGSKLRAVRKRSGLDYPEVVRRMANAGSNMAVRDLFRLEQATATPLPQLDATALVAALRVSLADIESTGAQMGRMRAFLASDVFDTTIRRWCDETGADVDASTRRARNELLTANFRGGDYTDFDDLAELLQALLNRWTDGDDQDPR